MPVERLPRLVFDLDAFRAHQQLESAEYEIAGEGHDGVREQVVEPRLNFETRQADPVHESGHDEPGRRERRQRARVAAVADHDRHQKHGDSHAQRRGHGHRREQARGSDVAGAGRRNCRAEREVHDRYETNAAATQTHGIVRHDVERTVHVRLAEQQRDTRQRQEQVDRKPGRHLTQRQMPHVNADDPGQRNREQPYVQSRRATQYDRERERRESNPPQAHRSILRPTIATDSGALARLQRLLATPKSRPRRRPRNRSSP